MIAVQAEKGQNRQMEHLIVVAALLVSLALGAAVAFGSGRNRCAVKPRIE